MSSSQRNQFVATVAANLPLCREHFRLVLRLDDFPQTSPGQFVQIECRDGDRDYERRREWDAESIARPIRRASNVTTELASPLAMLRRPFLAGGGGAIPETAGVELEIIHRVVGVGTDWMSRLKPQDRVHLLGPLGNQFELPPPRRDRRSWSAAAMGIPPMLYLAEAALAGARCRRVLRGADPRPHSVDDPRRSAADR